MSDKLTEAQKKIIAEKKAADRARAKTDKLFLATEVLGYDFQEDVHQELFDQFIQYDDKLPWAQQSHIAKRMILWPRGHFKSTAVVVEIIQIILNFPDTLARVTYLLAIGRQKLTDPNRGNIQIPVYLGDAIQWREQNVDLWSAGNLVIHTDEERREFEEALSFPDALLEDAARFDQFVNELADRSSRRTTGSAPPSLRAVFSRFHIPQEYQHTIESTFSMMCRLHDEGRDHIWGYYIRNLARPLWLSKEGNQVDMLIGNRSAARADRK